LRPDPSLLTGSNDGSAAIEARNRPPGIHRRVADGRRGYWLWMSSSSDEQDTGHGIEDEDLPEDLQPGDDNPLAQGLDDAETAGDLEPGELLEEGKTADQWDDEQLED